MTSLSKFLDAGCFPSVHFGLKVAHGFGHLLGHVGAAGIVLTGAIIDQGTKAIAVGVVLGILSEIGLRDRI